MENRKLGVGLAESAGTSESKERYVDLLTDSGFKAVFGDQQNKQVLIDLLNAVLPAGRQVIDLTYSTTELRPATLGRKTFVLDLRCEDVDGSIYVVELQKYGQEHFFKRCVAYAARLFASQPLRGVKDYDLPPVYLIGILAKDRVGSFGTDRGDRILSEFALREKETGANPPDTISLTFIELAGFTKTLDKCETIVDKWCYSFKNMSRLDRLPEDLQLDIFQRLFKAAEIAQFTHEKRIQYDKDMMTELDWENVLYTAEHRGEQRGLHSGEASAKATIARNLHKDGFSVEKIAELAELPAEQVTAILEAADGAL